LLNNLLHDTKAYAMNFSNRQPNVQYKKVKRLYLAMFPIPATLNNTTMLFGLIR